MSHRFFVLMTSVILCILPVCAESPNLLKNGDFEGTLENWTLKGTRFCQTEWLNVNPETDKVPFTRAFRVTVKPEARFRDQRISLRQPNNDIHPVNMLLVFRVWMRSSKKVRIALQMDDPKENVLVSSNAMVGEVFELTNDWQEYEVSSRWQPYFPSNEIGCKLAFLESEDSVDIANARLFCVKDHALLPELINRGKSYPGNLLQNGDFSDNEPRRNVVADGKAFGSWVATKTKNCSPEIVPAQIPQLKNAVRLTTSSTPESRSWNFLDQHIKDAPLTPKNDLVLRFLARGSQGAVVEGMLLKNSKPSFEFLESANGRPRDRPFPKAESTFPLTLEWKEYEMKLVFPPSSPETDGFVKGVTVILTVLPFIGTVDFTNIRLTVEPVAKPTGKD